MIPVRAQRRTSRLPVMVWAIAFACTATLVRLALLPDERAGAIVAALGVAPARLLGSPLSTDQILTLFTSPFLHAGWVHLAGNMLYLLVFGPAVLDTLGTRRFLGLYVFAGIVGALAHTAAHPASMAPLVGASGAIAGVLGAHLVLDPRAKVTTIVPVLIFIEVATLPAAFVIGLWFVLQLASALAPVAPTAAPAAVAWYAHLGGFATGVVLAAGHSIVTGRPERKRRPEGRRSIRPKNRRAA